MKTTKATALQVRVTTGMRSRIEKAAKASNLTVADWIRYTIAKRLDAER